MKQLAKVWGIRAFSVVIAVLIFQNWALPVYKQYFTPKETALYIPTAKVKEGKFVVSFHEIGTLEAERSVPVNTEISGKIITLVTDGKVVSTGDVIAVLDTTELEREIYRETLEHNNRVADLDKAITEGEIQKESNRTELEKAEAKLAFDKNELQLAREDLAKKERLAEEKLIPRTQVDQAKGVVRSRELSVAQGEADLQLKLKEVEAREKQKEADIRNVKFRTDMAEANLRQVEERLNQAIVSAPSSGLVVMVRTYIGGERRTAKEGDNVNPRQTLCVLPDLTSMLVKVQVGESDAPKVSIGMPTVIKLDAVPGRIFHGTVKDIAALVTEPSPWERSTGGKSFDVTVALTDNDPKTLKPGMSADVEFIIHSIDKTLSVPLESVVERNGKTYVFLKKGNDWVRTEVTLGKQNDNFASITKGLSKDQVVALRDPTRDLDMQEAGSAAPGVDTNNRQAPPIPGADKE